MTITGVHTIMPTPFTATGRLDEESLARLTDFLIRLGVDGLTVLGVLGEAPKLSEAEQDRVVTVTVSAAAGRVPVYAGASAGGTDLGIMRGLRALELGAAGLLVAPATQNDAAVTAQFTALDAAIRHTGAQVVIHDYPAATGVRLSVALALRLNRELESVTTIKLEEPPTGPKVRALKREAGAELAVLGGLGGTYLVEELESGADGIMTGFSFPELLVRVVGAYRDGTAAQRLAARDLFYRSCALLRYEFQPGVGLAIRKEVYRRRGAIDDAYVRAPGAQVDADLRRELDAVLEYARIPEWLTAEG